LASHDVLLKHHCYRRLKHSTFEAKITEGHQSPKRRILPKATCKMQFTPHLWLPLSTSLIS